MTAHKYDRELLYSLRKQSPTKLILTACKKAGILRFRGCRAGRKHKKLKTPEVLPDRGTRHQRVRSEPRILLSNVRSLKPKLEELEWVLDIEHIEVAALTETWLCEKVLDEEIFLKGYHVHREDRRNKQGGGVCLMICDNWQSWPIKHTVKMPGFAEILTVYLTKEQMPRFLTGIVIYLVYSPPSISRPQMKTLQETIALLHEYAAMKYPYAKHIILGDFNKMPQAMLRNATGLKQIVDTPTRGANTLDLCYTDLPDAKSTVGPPLATSDHATIYIELGNLSPLEPKKQRVIIARPKPQNAIRECGQRLMNMEWAYLDGTAPLEEKYNRFKEDLNDIMEDHFPTQRITCNDKSKPWYSHRIGEKVKERDEAYRRNDPRYQNLRREVRTTIQLAKKDYYQKRVADNRCEQPRLWHIQTSELAGRTRTPPPTLGYDIEELNVHFVSYGTPSNESPILKDTSTVDFESLQMQEYEVGNLLRKIKTSKAQPFGDPPAFLLQTYWVELAKPVKKIFNESLQTATLPSDWTCAQVIPIPKVKRPKNPGDYRPISIFPVLLKVLESYITGVIRTTKKKPDAEDQYGGRRGRSTAHYLVSLLEFVHRAVQHHRTVRIATLDVAKAYNSVNRDIIFRDIEEMGLHPVIENWTKEFLYKLRQVVRGPDRRTVSSALPLTAGVPQGTAVAGELFNSYMKETPATERLWSFVDDITAGAEGNNTVDTTNNLQVALNDIDDWLAARKLQLNASKSASMTFDFATKPQVTSTKLTLRQQDIPECSAIKILGVILQDDLKFEQQIRSIVGKARVQLIYLRRLAHARLPFEHLRQYYLTYVRPILDYAAPCWTAALTATQTEQLEMVQHMAVRLITNKWSRSYEDILSDLELQTLQLHREEQARKLAWKMFCDPSFRDLFPPRRCDVSHTNTRNSNKLFQEHYGTLRRRTSPIPFFTSLLNNSDLL